MEIIRNLIHYAPYSFFYVIDVPYFWASMGMTTAIAMLLTATLFDHDFRLITKAFIAKLSFMAMLFWVTVFRVNFTLDESKILPGYEGRPFAGVVTFVIVSFFWFVGIAISALILKLQKKLKK